MDPGFTSQTARNIFYGGTAFFVLLYTHTVPTNDFFSVPTKNRYALNPAFFTACR